MKKTRPKFLLTYLCTNCKMDIVRPETDPPKECSYCQASKEYLTVIKKEKFTKEKVFENLQKCVNRMCHSLEKAFEVRPTDGSFDLDTFLTVAQKAKKLKENVMKITKKHA
jgi:DNA-directed RNA polymerase subunit RPC12/RpoP